MSSAEDISSAGFNSNTSPGNSRDSDDAQALAACQTTDIETGVRSLHSDAGTVTDRDSVSSTGRGKISHAYMEMAMATHGILRNRASRVKAEEAAAHDRREERRELASLPVPSNIIIKRNNRRRE